MVVAEACATTHNTETATTAVAAVAGIGATGVVVGVCVRVFHTGLVLRYTFPSTITKGVVVKVDLTAVGLAVPQGLQLCGGLVAKIVTQPGGW